MRVLRGFWDTSEGHPSGARGAFGKRGELRPDDLRIDRRLADPSAVAAIRAGDDVLAANQPDEMPNALRHELRMLDEIRLRFEHARDQTLPSGSFTRSNTVHSWAWRGLAASKEIPLGRAAKTISMIASSGTS